MNEILQNSSELFIEWTKAYSTKRLPEGLRRKLIELYWEFINMLNNPAFPPSPQAIQWLFNRWLKNPITGKDECHPDDRLVRCFHINGKYIFKQGDNVG